MLQQTLILKSGPFVRECRGSGPEKQKPKYNPSRPVGRNWKVRKLHNEACDWSKNDHVTLWREITGTWTLTIIFQIYEQFYFCKSENSRLNILNTNCMENMAWVIKHSWYIFFHQQLKIKISHWNCM